MNRLSKEEFLQAAGDYIERLKLAPSTDVIFQMWRSTNLPYQITSSDPHSLQYRDEMLSLYRDLARADYDVSNEWTSSKQTPEMFEIGYPWVSKNLWIIADEFAKPIQVLRALHQMDAKEVSVIEFGSGWGNLALPLAKAGVNVTMVDIDQGFIERALRIANRDGLKLDHRCGDFLEVATVEQKQFDVAVFQSSFHHCLEFNALVRAIKSNVLKDDGVILFVNEPISRELLFPWGLRYDGESLWAIMCNQWLELGFHRDFFAEMLLNNGLLPTKLDGIPGLLDDGWKAVHGEVGVMFKDLILPSTFDKTYHAPDGDTSGRFCRAYSSLPQLHTDVGRGYEITFVNYGGKRLSFSLEGSGRKERIDLATSESRAVQFPAYASDVTIKSDTFIPDRQVGNGDIRTLGIYVSKIRTIANVV